MDKLSALLAFILAAAPQATPAHVALLRQPLHKWNLDYGETACTAARAYGTAEAPITFALRPSPNGSVVRLIIVRVAKVATPVHFPVTTSITSDAAKTTGLRFASGGGKKENIWINLDRPSVERLGAAGEIAIKARGIIDERLALPGMPAVLKALDKCNEDARTYWNVGAAAAGQLTKTAVSVKPLPSYFSDADYPDQAMREGATGATGVMLMINETGKLKDCMVEEASGIATLDAMTCGVLLDRAKFTPALDAAGKPTRSVYTTRIRWVM